MNTTPTMRACEPITTSTELCEVVAEKTGVGSSFRLELNWAVLNWAYQNISDRLQEVARDERGNPTYLIKLTSEESCRLKMEDSSVREDLRPTPAHLYKPSDYNRGWKFETSLKPEFKPE
jgi:hypothetical protein